MRSHRCLVLKAPILSIRRGNDAAESHSSIIGKIMGSKSAPNDKQLELFTADDEDDYPIASVPVSGEVRRLAAALPERLYFGTSSWSFPAWAGLVYEREASKAQIARHGLGAYARHPLLRCVGVDRTWYAPLASTEFRRYASVVPRDFRFVVKAHRACTTPEDPTSGRLSSGSVEPTPTFLDPEYAKQYVIEPTLDGFGGHVALILFQFPPLSVRFTLKVPPFIERLHDFLIALPRGPRYAVELRNWKLTTTEYFEALQDARVSHCFSGHPRAMSIGEQHALGGCGVPGATLIRWNLFPTLSYEEARDRYYPFNRIVNRDTRARDAIVKIGREALDRGDAVFVIANNKAEGCAPCSLFELAERVVDEPPTARHS